MLISGWLEGHPAASQLGHSYRSQQKSRGGREQGTGVARDHFSWEPPCRSSVRPLRVIQLLKDLLRRFALHVRRCTLCLGLNVFFELDQVEGSD